MTFLHSLLYFLKKIHFFNNFIPNEQKLNHFYVQGIQLTKVNGCLGFQNYSGENNFCSDYLMKN